MRWEIISEAWTHYRAKWRAREIMESMSNATIWLNLCYVGILEGLRKYN